MLIFHTVKHLRWEQLAYRPLRIAQYRLYRTLPLLAGRWRNGVGSVPQVTDRAVNLIRTVFETSFSHLRASLDERELADLCENRFTFLNRTLELDPLDWNQRYDNQLWNYQLHYFGFATTCARALTQRWT